MGLEAALELLGVFFAVGTAVALMLCGSAEDAEARVRRALEADADTLARSAEADQLVSR